MERDLFVWSIALGDPNNEAVFNGVALVAARSEGEAVALLRADVAANGATLDRYEAERHDVSGPAVLRVDYW